MNSSSENYGELLPFRASTYVEAIHKWAELKGDKPAFTYLGDGGVELVNLTYRELDQMVRAVGALLQQKGACKKPVLLAFPPGRDFLVAFLGCLFGGAIAVPSYPPDPARLGRTLPRFQAIALDCQAEFALTTATSLKQLDGLAQVAPKLKNLKWFSSDDLPASLADQWSFPAITPDDFAFLQYTSGSTGTPKGVMVSHRNLVLNFVGLTETFGDRPGDTLLTWLPNYHDMGLIDGLLRPFFLGSRGVVMSPMTFLKDPAIWAKMISKYRAATSGGPNFAYDLLAKKITDEELAQLDLSCWNTAYNGAEPVRVDTLRRFAKRFAPCGLKPEALGPGYGLAEATLMISCRGIGLMPIEYVVSRSELAQHRVVEVSPDDPEALTLVGCGRPMVGEVRIVDPETFRTCPLGRVGEIWSRGPSMAMGYWNKPEATFLGWLDCSALGLEEPPYEFFLREARVGLNEGLTFGPQCGDFVRLNFGTTRANLHEAISRMEAALATR